MGTCSTFFLGNVNKKDKKHAKLLIYNGDNEPVVYDPLGKKDVEVKIEAEAEEEIEISLNTIYI